MQTYSLFVRQLSESIHYVQQQLRLPLLSQSEGCAAFELAEGSRLELCANANVRSAKCLPLGQRLLAALERNGNLFSHSFAIGAARDCVLPVKLRVPGQADISLCQECSDKPAGELVARKSEFWPNISKIFVELLGHDRYRM